LANERITGKFQGLQPESGHVQARKRRGIRNREPIGNQADRIFRRAHFESSRWLQWRQLRQRASRAQQPEAPSNKYKAKGNQPTFDVPRLGRNANCGGFARAHVEF
jgi:hypothetical protein